MFIDMHIDFTREQIDKIQEELRCDGIKCFRRKVRMEYSDSKKDVSFKKVCSGYGNGFGYSSPCKGDCYLRIDDLNELIEVYSDYGYGLYEDTNSFSGQMKYLRQSKYNEYISKDDYLIQKETEEQ